MIKDPEGFRRWEMELIASEPPDHKKNLRIFEAMVEHAKKVGAWPPKDPMEGIEAVIRMARIINGLPPDKEDNDGS